MKRSMWVLASLAAVALVSNSFADAKHTHSAAASKPVTVKGEVVDLGCYMAHEAHGEKHKECGTKCVAQGMPMGLLSGNKLYVVTLNHDNADAYNQMKEWVGSDVEVTGIVSERAGVKSIDAASAKVATAAAK